MTRRRPNADVDAALAAFQRDVRQLQDKLKGEQESEITPEGFDAAAYWAQFEGLAKMVHKQSTTLCLAFTQEQYPPATTVKPLATQLTDTARALVDLLVILPPAQGSLVSRQSRDHVGDILVGLAGLGQATRAGPEAAKALLQSTGTLWQACDRCATSSKEPSNILRSQLVSRWALVEDAMKELEREARSGLDVSDWQRPRLLPVAALLKALLATLKEAVPLLGDASTSGLDALDDASTSLPPRVDDLATALYLEDEPVFAAELKKLHETSVAFQSQLIEAGVCGERDKERLAFLRTVLDHNLAKLSALA